jgi:hypothetical protein
MVCYEEWSEAEQQYLREMAADSRANERDNPETARND